MRINIPRKEDIINKVSKEILGVIYANKFIEEAVDKILGIFEDNKTYIGKRQEDEVAEELKGLLFEDTWDKYFDDLIEWSSEFPEFVDGALGNLVDNRYNIKTSHELLLIAYNDFILDIGDIIIDEVVKS